MIFSQNSVDLEAVEVTLVVLDEAKDHPVVVVTSWAHPGHSKQWLYDSHERVQYFRKHSLKMK